MADLALEAVRGGRECSVHPRLQRLVLDRVLLPFQEALEIVEVGCQAHGQDNGNEAWTICAVQGRQVRFELWQEKKHPVH